MEQSKFGGKGSTSVSDSNGEGVLPHDEKSLFVSPVPEEEEKAVDGKKTFDTVIMTQTPEKTCEPLRDRSEEEIEFKYLEKCETLLDFFDAMVCSFRLLRLRRKQTTFANICTQVDILTERKISCKDLAQIKYILPDAIHIEVVKIRKLENEVFYVKPDMKITLLFEVAESRGEKSKYSLLREVFTSRLTDFYDKHPEAFNIPEAVLPAPFTCVDQISTLEHFPAQSVGQYQSIACEFEQPIQASLLGPSFRRCFSRRAAVEVDASLSMFPSAKSGNSNYINDGVVPPTEVSGQCSKSECVSEQMKISKEQEESITVDYSISSADSRNIDSPQIKASATDALTIETPVLLTPRRSITGSEKEKRVTTQTSSFKPAKRSLNFSALEEDESSLNLDVLKHYADTVGIAIDSSEPPQKHTETSRSGLCHRED